MASWNLSLPFQTGHREAERVVLAQRERGARPAGQDGVGGGGREAGLQVSE